VKPDSDQVTVLNYNLCQNADASGFTTAPVNQKKIKKRKRPLYFQNTLSSHCKIEKLSLLVKKSRSECKSIHQTPAQKGRFMTQLNSPTNEIEHNLPQMSKLFSSAKASKQLQSNIKQCKLDLSDVN
jgi:hypothetical protein